MLRNVVKAISTIGYKCGICMKTGRMHRGWIIDFDDGMKLQCCWQCWSKNTRNYLEVFGGDHQTLAKLSKEEE
jgi:hypothetical protein